MLNINEGMKIYLSTSHVDMRKSIDGLSVLVQEQLKQDPSSGHLFIFYNRYKNKIKCLHYTRRGFGLYYRRLDKGRFKVVSNALSDCVLLEHKELEWLLSGVDFQAMRQSPEWQLKELF